MASLPWVMRAPCVPYFKTEAGAAWTPVGQNDAMCWPELSGLLHRRDPAAAERYVAMLAAHGVTVMRLMLEYAEFDEHYFERRDGGWNEAVVQFWDDLFPLCERHGVRLLLTPMDTFFTWIRWAAHPWNAANGGPCPSREQIMTHPGTRAAIKRRLAFATRRWGGSGALFAWDLYNEMHPAQGENRAPACFAEYIEDVSPWLRALEQRLHGRAHPQCVSVFGPELIWKPWIAPPIFRHPSLDFANSHFYGENTIDDPVDTVTPAVEVARLVRDALREIEDDRPFFESEHGPIHTYKDRGVTLPTWFDDEYFRHIQWAHLASGGAGGGMRWPNRQPHGLTPGMRRAQRAMAGFLPLIDWLTFRRRPLDLRVRTPEVLAFGCGDAAQAVLWVVRRAMLPSGLVSREPGPARVVVPGLAAGRYRTVMWDTRAGRVLAELDCVADGEGLALDLPPFGGDAALAVRSRDLPLPRAGEG